MSVAVAAASEAVPAAGAVAASAEVPAVVEAVVALVAVVADRVEVAAVDSAVGEAAAAAEAVAVEAAAAVALGGKADRDKCLSCMQRRAGGGWRRRCDGNTEFYIYITRCSAIYMLGIYFICISAGGRFYRINNYTVYVLCFICIYNAILL